LVDNIKVVAIGILEDYEIVIGVVGLEVVCSPYLEHPLNLAISVVRIEVKMQPISTHELFLNPLRDDSERRAGNLEEMAHFAESILNDKTPYPSIEDGRRALAVCRSILKSVRSKSAVQVDYC